jgi:hypothetical protein
MSSATEGGLYAKPGVLYKVGGCIKNCRRGNFRNTLRKFHTLGSSALWAGRPVGLFITTRSERPSRGACRPGSNVDLTKCAKRL